MKKILFTLSIFLILASCNSDDEVRYRLELIPVQEVDIPNSFQSGHTYTIKVRYNRPSTCHTYNGMYFDKQDNTRIFAVENIVFERNDCQDLLPNLIEQQFDFNVLNTSGSYLFKFWQGKNGNGENTYYEVEIPVVD